MPPMNAGMQQYDMPMMGQGVSPMGDVPPELPMGLNTNMDQYGLPPVNPEAFGGPPPAPPAGQPGLPPSGPPPAPMEPPADGGNPPMNMDQYLLDKVMESRRRSGNGGQGGALSAFTSAMSQQPRSA